MPIPKSGGSEAMMLKKENGAAFLWPFSFRVVIHAIGRGTTLNDINL